jgi:hypothetical protein
MIPIALGMLGAGLALSYSYLLQRLFRRLMPRVLPPAVRVGLTVVDQVLPVLVQEGATGQQLKDRVAREVEELTAEEWRQIRREFDPEVFLDKLLTSTL